MQSEILVSQSVEDLNKQLNELLGDLQAGQLIDAQYRPSFTEDWHEYSCLVIYK